VIYDVGCVLSRLQRQEAALIRQQQTSSLIGFGRNDLPSQGVLDAFSGHGYTNSTKAPNASMLSSSDSNTSSSSSAVTAATTTTASSRRSTDTSVSRVVATAAIGGSASGRLRPHQSAPSSANDISQSSLSITATSTTIIAAAGGGGVPEAARVRARGRGARQPVSSLTRSGVADALRPLSNTGAAIIASSPLIPARPS
jgi:hypothetical protein